MEETNSVNHRQTWRQGVLIDFVVESKERNIDSHTYPVYSVTNTNGFVLQTDHFARAIHSRETSKYKVFHKDDFGYNPARINVGSIAINEENIDGLLSPMYVVFRTRLGLSPQYLKYWVQTRHFRNQVINNTAGTVRESLNFSGFQHFSFKFPASLQEQNIISEILLTCDQVIEKTKARLDKLRRIRNGLMQDLFRYGLDKNGEMRSESSHKFKNSALGRIPEEWEINSLGNLCVFKSGGTPTRSNLNYWSGNIPWVSPKDMKSLILNDSQEHITEKAAVMESRMVPVNTVLIVIRGMILAHTFPVAITGRSLAFNQDIKALVCGKKILPNFLAHWISSNEGSFLKLATESTHGTKRLDMKDLKQSLVVLPSLSEQENIVSCISKIDILLKGEQDEITKLHRIKIGLLNDLLFGLVRVNHLTASFVHAQ